MSNSLTQRLAGAAGIRTTSDESVVPGPHAYYGPTPEFGTVWGDGAIGYQFPGVGILNVARTVETFRVSNGEGEPINNTVGAVRSDLELAGYGRVQLPDLVYVLGILDIAGASTVQLPKLVAVSSNVTVANTAHVDLGSLNHVDGSVSITGPAQGGLQSISLGEFKTPPTSLSITGIGSEAAWLSILEGLISQQYGAHPLTDTTPITLSSTTTIPSDESLALIEVLKAMELDITVTHHTPPAIGINVAVTGPSQVTGTADVHTWVFPFNPALTVPLWIKSHSGVIGGAANTTFDGMRIGVVVGASPVSWSALYERDGGGNATVNVETALPIGTSAIHIEVTLNDNATVYSQFELVAEYEQNEPYELVPDEFVLVGYTRDLA